MRKWIKLTKDSSAVAAADEFAIRTGRLVQRRGSAVAVNIDYMCFPSQRECDRMESCVLSQEATAGTLVEYAES